MKNKRKILPLAATAALYISTAAVPIYAGTPCIIPDNTTENIKIYPDDPYFQDILDTFPSDTGSISYIIDFLDQDGSILDSKICRYGEKLEDIKTPDPTEDERYTYRFIGWDPQLPETVTGSMAFTAVYQKTAKNTVSAPEIQETPDPIIKASSDGSNDLAPDKITQVSSTSYDVTPFHIETPAARPEAADIPDIPKEIPIGEDTILRDTILEDTISKDTLSEDNTAPAVPNETKILSASSLTPGYTEPVNITETPTPTVAADIQIAYPTHIDLYGRTEKAGPSVPARPTDKAIDPSPTAAMSPDPEVQSIQKTTPTATYTAQTCETSESRFPFPVLLISIIACSGAVCLKKR